MSAPRHRLSMLFPHYADDTGNAHVALSLASHMGSDGLEVALLQTASNRQARRPFTRNAIAPWLQRLAYRLGGAERLNRHAEQVFLSSLRPGQAAYLWPGTTVAICRQIKERGHTLILERINCHTGTSRRILDDAHARLGLPPGHGITDTMVREETEQLDCADLVFAPSPMVEASLLEHGVPAEKILATSYGWDPGRLSAGRAAAPKAPGLTVLFAGLVGVRKGAHLLLEAWAEAGIEGRLLLAGSVDEAFPVAYASLLNRPGVEALGYVSDIQQAFLSADVFAFPSLEEGGPLVTYEAMACGLPVLVSPMGAGRVARADQDGFVLDPYDRDAWVDALRRLANDSALRRALGESARQRAAEFTWDQVGRRRGQLLLEALGRTGS